MTNRSAYEWLGRSVDLAVASLGLALSAPLLALVGAAIAAASGRPIIYRGLRVGRGATLFEMFKFRTMVPQAEALGSSITRHSDVRVTRFGRFLRRCKLDELPQLWNVVKGEMSLVGPRPDTPEIIETYTPSMRGILEVKPGMTSLASLWLRNESELLRGVDEPDDVYENVIVPAKVELALTHVRRRSLLFDWGVLLATLAAGFGIRRPSQAEREFLSNLRARVLAYTAARAGESPMAGQREAVSGQRDQASGEQAGQVR